MATTTKPIDRDTLVARIVKLEGQIARAPRDGTTVEASIKHASLQIAYWRAQQILHSYDTRAGGQTPDVDEFDLRKVAMVESRKCTERAAEWERRKDASMKLLVLRELEALHKKMDALMNAGAAIKNIATG